MVSRVGLERQTLELSADYEKWSPSNFAKNFKTPTLVISGERDYRVPYTQSLHFFTDLQQMKVPSRLIIYSNAGHWPSWYEMALYYTAHVEWFNKYLGGEPRLGPRNSFCVTRCSIKQPASGSQKRQRGQAHLLTMREYREAVAEVSPGLPRLAATLGKEHQARLEPQRGSIGSTNGKPAPTPLGLSRMHILFPRVAAKRGNPGLNAVTASR